MKLIVQVPCFNEEETLPLVINSVPKKIEGVDSIETLIIDDGSRDRTIEVAKGLGVNHIVKHRQNQGLAASFVDGIDECLRQGADIIVNTDGDNQYPQQDIGKLIAPILAGTHDVVIGDRQVQKIEHFSEFKKMLQKIGTGVVQYLSGINVADAPSGFRAYSRQAALSINVISSFSYTIETIIQSANKRIAVTHSPVTTNPKTRESRLFKSMFGHVRKSGLTIMRIYAMYQPFRIFLTLGTVLTILGLILFARFGYLMITAEAVIGGHLQSIILGSALLIVGVLIFSIGIVADLLAINRKLIEDVLERIKLIEFQERPAKFNEKK
jgi:glycosyltransferase involved in cell wall biosynthesis